MKPNDPRCGVMGHDLECEACGEKLYGRKVEDVCPYKRRTRSEVMALQSSIYGCCNRHADNMACDCLSEAMDDAEPPQGRHP